jgi:hypothetical protein
MKPRLLRPGFGVGGVVEVFKCLLERGGLAGLGLTQRCVWSLYCNEVHVIAPYHSLLPRTRSQRTSRAQAIEAASLINK